MSWCVPAVQIADSVAADRQSARPTALVFCPASGTTTGGAIPHARASTRAASDLGEVVGHEAILSVR